jgi:hypothetical protein
VRAKEGWNMAQVVEHLPSKCKALSSNHSIAKKEKEVIIFIHHALF